MTCVSLFTGGNKIIYLWPFNKVSKWIKNHALTCMVIMQILIHYSVGSSFIVIWILTHYSPSMITKKNNGKTMVMKIEILGFIYKFEGVDFEFSN